MRLGKVYTNIYLEYVVDLDNEKQVDTAVMFMDEYLQNISLSMIDILEEEIPEEEAQYYTVDEDVLMVLDELEGD